MITTSQKTLEKFGYPESLVKEYSSWLVLLRPQQVTLGSLVLIEKSGKYHFSDLSKDSFVELSTVIEDVEKVLADEFHYDKLNYLMLMMVDPEVHFHLIPRYSENRSVNLITFTDPGWPALPKLDHINEIPSEIRTGLVTKLRARFSRRSSDRESG